MLYRFAPVLVSLALVSLAAPALAAPPATETLIGLVPTEGLDLTTTPGQSALNTRVRQEVNTLCGSLDSYDALAEAIAIHRCRVQALRDAQPQIIEAEHRAIEAQSATTARLSSAN